MNFKIFTDYVMFTRTVEIKLYIGDITLHESDLHVKLEPDDKIIKIQSKAGVKTNKNFVKNVIKKSNRGRPKTVKDDKLQMYTQTTLHIISSNYRESNKIYKPKVFRNGVIQISGILQNDLSDMYYVIDIIIKKLIDIYAQQDIHILTHKIIMLNIKSRFNDSYFNKYFIDLEKLIYVFHVCINNNDPSVKIMGYPSYDEERNAFISVSVCPMICRPNYVLKFKIYKTGNLNISLTLMPDTNYNEECICIKWLEDILLLSDSNLLYKINDVYDISFTEALDNLTYLAENMLSNHNLNN